MSTIKKIDQKEYLKRYLSNDSDKKKKKKKKEKRGHSKINVKIIDDDDFGSKVHQCNVDESELFGLGDEAPQIVGIIDERPPELKAKEDFNSSKWKKLAADSDTGWGVTSGTKPFRPRDNRDESSSSRNMQVGGRRENPTQKSNKRKEARHNSNSDHGRESPPIRTKKQYDSDQSPPGNHTKGRTSDSDASPPRRKERRNRSPTRKSEKEYDSNRSPSRKHTMGKLSRNSDESPPRRNLKERRRDSDESPPRKGRRYSDSDPSPPRRKHESHSREVNSQRRRHDSDESPPRRRCPATGRNADSDQSPPRRSENRFRVKQERSLSPTRSRTSGYSSVRVKQEPLDSDESPPRRKTKPHRRRSRSRSKDSDSSPPRRIKREPRDDDAEAGPSSRRMTTTLEGKRAGLQDAKALKVENEKHRQRENEVFDKMSAEMSGRYAKTVAREKYGKRRDVEEELRKEFEKRKHDEKKKEKYTRWGKGVKQVEDYKAQLEEAAHEMNKPLARYADDEDLDEYLKKQERIGDPMLDYIRSKKNEKDRQEGRPRKPLYKGSFPDNRFGIRPGYRWDGVDRSNGFEKKWFEMTSKKKAVEEEAYKYSVEDM